MAGTGVVPDGRRCPVNHRGTSGVDDAVREALGGWGGHDQRDPFPIYAELLARGPAHQVTLADGHAAWLVVEHDAARAALNDPRLSKDMQAALASDPAVVAEGLPGPAFARHMINVDPPDHSRLRRLVSAAFTNRRVEALRPHVQAIVDRLLDAVAAEGPEAEIDLVASFTFPFPFTVICELLGVAEADRERLGEHLTLLLGPTATPAQYERAKVGSDVVVQMLHDVVDQKQRTPGDDLVTDLIRARDGAEQLTTEELLSTMFLLIVAGHETTTNLIGNAVVHLFRHPEQLAALRADPSGLVAAVEELARYDGPAHHATFRYATEDVEYGGVTIPAGAQVVICLAAANRDAARFEHPEALDLGRGDNRHLAFGFGIHHCLGAALARMEAQLAVGTLLRRFPELRPAVRLDTLEWGHGDGVVLRGLSSLPVIPGPSA